MIRLIRNSAEPLHQQLYRQIRDELVSGSFSNNSSRLPSSRALASDLGISRLTVNLALEKLHAEGYLRTRIGSGTFIADSLPETFLSPRQPKTQLLIERPPRLSNRVKNIPDKRAGKQFDFGIAGPPGVSFVPALAGARRIPHRNLGASPRTSPRQIKVRICCNTHRAAATQTCARRSRPICAITEARAVTRTRLLSLPGRSRR